MLEAVLSCEYNLSTPARMDQEPSSSWLLEQHTLKMLVCFRHPPAIVMTVKQSCAARGQ